MSEPFSFGIRRFYTVLIINQEVHYNETYSARKYERFNIRFRGVCTK